MIDKFLKAKHWQIFLLTIGIPMVLQFILFLTLISSGVSNGNKPSLEFISIYLKIVPLLMIIIMGVFFGWFWSVGIGINEIIPNELKLKVKRFKFFLMVPILYILFISIYVGTIMNGITNEIGEPNLAIFGLIIFLHLFSMFCIFYCLYSIAKTIKTAELKKKVKFGDFAGEFFLILFFPIGIWIIQPKINKLIDEKGNDYLL